MPLVKDVVARMKEAGLDDVPVVVGGIIPPEDASALKSAGVAEVYTPKDFELNRIMSDLCASWKDRRTRRNNYRGTPAASASPSALGLIGLRK